MHKIFYSSKHRDLNYLIQYHLIQFFQIVVLTNQAKYLLLLSCQILWDQQLQQRLQN